MHIVERGRGAPLVVIPGLQGRWEYVRPAVDALAEYFRVITFSLGDEPAADWRFDRRRGMDGYADQVAAALDSRGLRRAALCGVSFGGLVALRFAARDGERASALIMASTPGPTFHLKRRHDVYARLPWVFGPLFFAESPWRLRPEVMAALPALSARRQFAGMSVRTAFEAPLSFPRMAARARFLASHDRAKDALSLSCPTLVIHGEPTLDRVVDTRGTLDYVGLIRGARAAKLPQTGHLGSVIKPGEFAGLVRAFLVDVSQGSNDHAA